MLSDWATIEGTVLDFAIPSFKETVRDPLTAAIEAVNDIVNNYPAPYNLMVSGGLDSQAMLYAWKMSGHPFNAYCFRYNKTFNEHDIKTLPIFCEQENISYTIVDFDYFKFLEEEYDSIAKRYKCSSPQISMHIKMASFFEGTCMYSGNFLNIQSASLTYALLGVYRFSQTSEGKNIVPYFFLHTPELAYSFNFLGQHRNIKDGRYKSILPYYNRVIDCQLAGFPVVAQEKKLNGFEKFKEYYDSHGYVLKDFRNKMKWHSKPSQRPFDWLFRYPYEDQFGEPPLTFILNKLPYVIT
jgi:hypothetical protein